MILLILGRRVAASNGVEESERQRLGLGALLDGILDLVAKLLENVVEVDVGDIIIMAAITPTVEWLPPRISGSRAIQ